MPQLITFWVVKMTTLMLIMIVKTTQKVQHSQDAFRVIGFTAQRLICTGEGEHLPLGDYCHLALEKKGGRRAVEMMG